MLKEIFHYLTLSNRTRKRLRECVKIASTSQGFETESINEIEKLIKNQEIGKAIDKLNIIGNELNVSNKQYWSNMYLVARDHKMRDGARSLENKVKSVGTSN
jgi:hypothetical protein